MFYSIDEGYLVGEKQLTRGARERIKFRESLNENMETHIYQILLGRPQKKNEWELVSKFKEWELVSKKM